MTDVDVAVVGGGIAGLAAANAAQRSGATVALLEADSRLGGKVQTETFLGSPVDTGPDAFLARRPEAVGLCRELGLDDELVSPATGQAYVWTRGQLQAIPPGLVLGVPARLGPLLRSPLLSPAGRARALLDLVLPARHRDGDVSIGDLVSRRFGDEVAQRLVDPLLGGINAGRSERLSAAASAPQLMTAAARGHSLARSLRSQPATAVEGPVFYSLRDGTGRLVAKLRETLDSGGAVVRTATLVVSLDRRAEGWRLVTAAGEDIDARSVVLAVPAFAAAELLRPLAASAADQLLAIDYASVALVTLAFEPAALPVPDGSGFLVPRVDGRLLSACTWFSTKWPQVRPDGKVVVRLSAGKAGDHRIDNLDDGELTARLLSEMHAATGAAANPVASRVNRWPLSFPQYDVGHLERVERLDREVEALGSIALAGAAYRGVGIPACIGSAERAVAVVTRSSRR